MSQSPAHSPVRIPRWLLWVGSVAIAAHFAAIGVNALAAMSGPWPNNDNGMVGPPFLAAQINDAFGADYLKLVRLNTNYHVLANHLPSTPGVYLEFRLEDEQGNELAVVKLPNAVANPWVRHRQSLLTQQELWEDRRVVPQQSELIAAPGGEVPKTQYWQPDKKGRLELVTVDVNKVPLAQPVSGPTDFSFMLARAYARHLCRTHGAAKAQVLRHHQNAVTPFVLRAENVPARDFEEVVSNFGEFSR
ncbi:MAG TPA: hypothetical protein VKE94_14205 [Gemmataceae bacterium]|nr:hypothetical protein [Gemmataceae bacterium]